MSYGWSINDSEWDINNDYISGLYNKALSSEYAFVLLFVGSAFALA